MDAARQGYYHVYGGAPGLTWLLDGFSAAMTAAGSTRRSGAACSWTIRPGPSRSPRSIDELTNRSLTSVVGSHARPSWFVPGIAAADAASSGRTTSRRCSTTRVDLAIRDQEEAGIDVVCDGEMRRAGFFTAEFYRHLTGVRRAAAGPSARRRRPRPAAPLRGPRADRGARRARRRRGVPLRADAHDPAAQGDPARAVHAVGPADLRARPGLPGPHRRRRGVRADPRAELEGLVDAGADVHPDRRAVAGHPPRRPGRLRGAVQRGGRADRRAGPARRPPVLRQLPRPAARPADLPAGPRRDARVPRRRAGARVREPRDGRGRASSARSPRPAGTSPPASSTSRTTTSSRPTRSPSGSTQCSLPASRRSALTLVPDCGFSQTARAATPRQAAGAGRRARPRPRPTRPTPPT